MARSEERQAQLISEIRARRQRLVHEVEDATSLGGIASRVRDTPWPWIAAAAIGGVVVGRLWGPSLLRAGRQRATSQIKAQAIPALASALFAIAGGRQGRASSETPPGAPRP